MSCSHEGLGSRHVEVGGANGEHDEEAAALELAPRDLLQQPLEDLEYYMRTTPMYYCSRIPIMREL